MSKIDWKRKLSSRKFWAWLVDQITALLYLFGYADTTVKQIVAVLALVSGSCVYMLAEASTDNANGGGDNV